ncbi:hypothetical protein [Geothrix sp. 21YS21S-4]|uniref:hypothetical protein n=1 Tax=Geothrix sp. 21YS21S-4 TaxID=3068889 RepID=UPI0027B943F8|nr:hypothetical protein [Geothrix sp. 21YS21S-4]
MVDSRWQTELEIPTEGFFDAFASQLAQPDGLRDGLREAVKVLIPRIDWEAYLPHVPQGILGLRAVLRLRPLLTEGAFRRALAIQLHMAAHEGRRASATTAQAVAAKGSGTWRNLESFIQSRKPGLAYAEAQGFDLPDAADFRRLGALVEGDMANVGHKGVFTAHLADLHERLERPKATGRRLFGLAAWLAATQEDTFWYRRAAKRMEREATDAPAAGNDAAVREICDLGLVGMLDAFTGRIKAGASHGQLLSILVEAASEKLLDARRDLEGKTAWTLVYLAHLAETPPSDPCVWAQGAALVNLFPTDEPEERVQPKGGVPDGSALLEAILDAEAPEAMGHAQALCRAGKADEALARVAEAATFNDPTFNHASQILAAAATADLLPHLPSASAEAMLVALAKSFANSQGSGDLGRLADRALG